MDLGSIFLILAVIVPVVLYITKPLMERSAREVTPEEHQLSTLMAERDRILNAIQELDFDHTLGKIPESVYEHQRAVLMRAGAETLRQIDAYQGGQGTSNLDDRIESAVVERKTALQGSAASLSADPDDELEILIAKRRRSQKEEHKFEKSGFCPQCGSCVQETDRFCPKCGNTLG